MTGTRAIDDLLTSQERALFEKILERRGRGSDWIPALLGIVMVPVLGWLAWSHESQPDREPLLLALVAGFALGVCLTRWLADRREAVFARLYGRLARTS